MANLFVIKGDITRTVPVEAIVTLINSDGMWFGGVDGAIQRVAGRHYHAQAGVVLNTSGLINAQSVVAKGDQAYHNGSFDNVVFVVDDLQSPLNELVYTALQTAKREGYSSVALPLMRTGVMLGLVEPDVRTVVQQMRLGIDRFLEEGDVNMDIYIVVYGEPEAVKMLSGTMKLLNT